jgi:hypothetical protein
MGIISNMSGSPRAVRVTNESSLTILSQVLVDVDGMHEYARVNFLNEVGEL